MHQGPNSPQRRKEMERNTWGKGLTGGINGFRQFNYLASIAVSLGLERRGKDWKYCIEHIYVLNKE